MQNLINWFVKLPKRGKTLVLAGVALAASLVIEIIK